MKRWERMQRRQSRYWARVMRARPGFPQAPGLTEASVATARFGGIAKAIAEEGYYGCFRGP